jgi:hypothetical protein
MKTFEEKVATLQETYNNYCMGFITAFEFLNQVYNIGWNEYERSLIERVCNDCVTVNVDAFKMALSLKSYHLSVNKKNN